MNPFAERYQTYSNAQLAEVLENQSDYREEAITAAKEEWESRNLTEEDWKEAKAENESKNLFRRRELEQINAILGNGTGFLGRIIHWVSSIYNVSSIQEKAYRGILTYFILHTIIGWYSIAGFIYFMFTDDLGGWDFSSFLYISPFIFATIGTVLFGLKMTIGWVLMMIYCLTVLIAQVGGWIIRWVEGPPSLEIFQDLYSPYPSLAEMLAGIILGLVTWAMLKPYTREYFSVSKNRFQGTLAITAVWVIIMIAMWMGA